MFKKRKQREKELYNLLSEEDKKRYEDLCKGIPVGNLEETIAFVVRVEELKRKP